MLNKLKAARDAFLYPAALCFTITLLLFYGIGSAVNTSTRGTPISLSFQTILLVLGFSVGFALCGLIFRVKGLNLIIKVTLHFAGTLLFFFIFLVLLSGYFASTSGGLFISLIYMVLYALAAAIILGVRALILRKKNEEAPYKGVYDKLKND